MSLAAQPSGVGEAAVLTRVLNMFRPVSGRRPC